MKTLTLITLAIGLTAPAVFGQADASRLKGAWELVRYDYGGGKKAPGTTEVKLITDRHFVWVNYDHKGKAFSEGGGTYTFNGSTLVERLAYANKELDFLLGEDQALVVSFDNGTFTSVGTLSTGQRIVELWKRMN